MSDTLNALQTANRTSSVLQAIANPAQVNPLAAVQSGISAASNEYDLASKQGSLLVGQALQQATDENGNVDIGKAQKIAAGMGPNAAFAMQGFLKTGAALRGSQIEQGGAMYNNIARAGISVATDPSDENIEAQRAAMLRQFPGQAQQINAEFDAVKAMKLPADRVAAARNHAIGALDASDRMHQTFGTTFRQTGPTGATMGGWQAPAWQGGGVAAPAGQPGAPQGLDPGQQAQFQQWLQGEVEIPDPNNPGGTQKATRIQMFQRMGVDPKLFYPGSGGGGGGPPPASPPASPNASPNVRTPPSSPNVSPNVGSPLTVASPADTDTQKAGAQMGIALSQRAGQVPDNQANLGNMLTDANKLDSMGAGSSREAYLNSFFQKWSGSGLLGNSTQQQIAAAESFNKIGNIMAANQMAALGASDARQQLSIGANPHLDLSKLGNEQIIHMLQGNEDAIAAKSRAWEDWKLSHGSGSYAQFQNDLNKNFDLRVFQQRYMTDGTNGTPDEIGAMRKQMQSQGTDKEFVRKILYARAQHWIP